jgi:hypothetical protein
MRHNHPAGQFITTHQKTPEILGHNFYKFQAKALGAFPFRNDDKSLGFPADNTDKIFCCTGWELIEAEKLGLLKDCIHIEQKLFLETQNFQKYVDHYYTIKATTKKGSPENIFSKLYLNSAYGKFAANPEKYKKTYLCPAEDFGRAVKEGFSFHGEIHDRFIISKPNDEDEWRHYNVATGASITGFVRAYLLRAIKSVGNPIYCDTDSIIFTGDHNLAVGKDLGQWSSEGEFITGGIGGKKIYAFKSADGKEKTACKGLILNYDEIIRVCNGETITKTPDSPIYSIKKGKYFLKKSIAMT